MKVIDMKRIREALPARAVVKLKKKKTSEGNIVYIECLVRWPGLYDKGSSEEQKIVDEVFKWQRQIIGAENISEFYTEETGSHWLIYLKRIPMEFINTTDADINSYSGLEIITDGKLNKIIL